MRMITPDAFGAVLSVLGAQTERVLPDQPSPSPTETVNFFPCSASITVLPPTDSSQDFSFFTLVTRPVSFFETTRTPSVDMTDVIFSERNLRSRL